MSKLIGYVEMKNKHGKVLYCTREVSYGVGEIPFDKPIFLYDDEADMIDASCIGKEIKVSRGVTIGN